MKLEAQNIASIDTLSFARGNTGEINRLTINTQVNFGVLGLPFALEIYPHMEEKDKVKLTEVIDCITAIANKLAITDELDPTK